MPFVHLKQTAFRAPTTCFQPRESILTREPLPPARIRSFLSSAAHGRCSGSEIFWRASKLPSPVSVRHEGRFPHPNDQRSQAMNLPHPSRPSHRPRCSRPAYTLVELMIALSISLFLLIGVTQMFRDVGTSINDTQSTLVMSSNLSGVGLQLRSDLSEIPAYLAEKASLYGTGASISDSDGYLEIIEGMNAPPVYKSGDNNYVIHVDGLHVPSEKIFYSPDSSNNEDLTVGDVDDIIMFTSKAKDSAYPYRGLINGDPSTSQYAEIAWFVRGKTLYRRVQLIDEDASFNTPAGHTFYQANDRSVRWNSSNNAYANGLSDLADRRNRFGRTSNNLPFPYPLYRYNTNSTYNTEDWYYLRLPTLEEMVTSNWRTTLNSNSNYHLPPCSSLFTLSNPVTTNGPFWDLWDNPYKAMIGNVSTDWTGVDQLSGSLSNFVNTPRSTRAGEDIVLTNVISFDVKVWNPYWVPCCLVTATPSDMESDPAWLWAPPQFIDLGQDRFTLLDDQGDEQECKVNYLQNINRAQPARIPSSNRGYGFTLKGRYNSSSVTNTRLGTDAGTEQSKEQLRNGARGNAPGYWFNNGSSGADPLPCVYDSWTERYETGGGTVGQSVRGIESAVTSTDPVETWTCPPPYGEKMEAIQVVIRCYDPLSKNVRQIRIVHRFR